MATLQDQSCFGICDTVTGAGSQMKCHLKGTDTVTMAEESDDTALEEIVYTKTGGPLHVVLDYDYIAAYFISECLCLTCMV